jgi:hypothetical protein
MQCKEMCAEIQDQYLKELRDFSEVSQYISVVYIFGLHIDVHFDVNQTTKVYQHSCHNTIKAHSKLVVAKDKLEASRDTTRKMKAEKEEEEVIKI